LEQQIAIQLDQILAGNPKIKLAKPCRVGDGILTIDENHVKSLEQYFEIGKEEKEITFFIPASGSGSRMFDNLFNYLNSDNNISPETFKFVEKLLNRINEFAFYNKIPRALKASIKSGDVVIRDLIEFILLNNKGLKLGSVPKGLVPFHRYGKFIINPFQEHIIQGAKIAGDNTNFHFTIDPKFQDEIKRSIQIIREISGIDFQYFFSEQDQNTHAYAFDKDNQLALDENQKPIRRPAGHGTLIDNLNAIDSDLIFIKNIDNVQHYRKAGVSLSTKRILGGLTLQFQTKVFEIIEALNSNNNDSLVLVSTLNSDYNLDLSETQLNDKTFLMDYFNRPIRVCGMVKNEGQPGGGPFWVSDDKGNLSKQIIEKSQIASDTDQLSISLHATHFNPVELICAVRNYKGEKFNLKEFVDENQYFLVNKTHEGKEISYIEKPGLWNGGMFDWLTLFYEIDSQCFSPVKTVLDLLNPLHLEK